MVWACIEKRIIGLRRQDSDGDGDVGEKETKTKAEVVG